MPLSSEADSRLPSHSAGGERDNEGADSPAKKKKEKKNFTQKGREESARGTGSASAQRKTFLLSPSPFLLRLFSQTAPQMLVQTCSNSPTDHVGRICTCVTQAKEAAQLQPLPCPPRVPFSPGSELVAHAVHKQEKTSVRRLESPACRLRWQNME